MPKKARKNIVCYKVFEYTATCLITPYQRMEMQLGREEKQEFIMPKNKKRIHIYSEKYDLKIDEGFFHAYTDKRYAIDIMFRLAMDNIKHIPLVVVECEIPKDSLYFKGRYIPDICSTSIKPIKILR